MALSTYSELQASVASFLDRDDLASVVRDFIRLAEADMNRRLRHYHMEYRSTTTISERYSALPRDWLETIRVSIDGDALELVSQSKMLDVATTYSDTPGQPRFYAHTNGSLEVLPAPDQAYSAQMVFVRQIPPLTDDDPTNWLLDEAPDVYLYGALVHSAPFLQEDARAQTWSGFYENALAGLNRASEQGKHSGTGLRMRFGKNR